jgi:hypothetical protein
MYTPIEIEIMINHPDAWRVTFISAASLGIYLSLIITGFSRIRRHQTIYLGFYLVALSILLLHLSTFIVPISHLSAVLDSANAASLFLIGPFSYQVFGKGATGKRPSILFHLQYLPATLTLVLIQLNTFSLQNWIYLAGLFHTGTYLAFQTWMVFGRGKQWKKVYTGIQILAFSAICMAFASSKPVHLQLVTSICLVILITIIWIRLMRTAITQFINQLYK